AADVARREDVQAALRMCVRVMQDDEAGTAALADGLMTAVDLQSLRARPGAGRQNGERRRSEADTGAAADQREARKRKRVGRLPSSGAGRCFHSAMLRVCIHSSVVVRERAIQSRVSPLRACRRLWNMASFREGVSMKS